VPVGQPVRVRVSPFAPNQSTSRSGGSESPPGAGLFPLYRGHFMQVTIETTSALERRVTIGVPAERVESEVNARLQRAAQTARLNGFRPGKVPMSVIRQRFGEGVRQEVLGEVMSRTFYEAVQQE